MKYKILTISRITDYHQAVGSLTNMVNDLIQKEWKPQGGICISSYKVGDDIFHTLMQAMVKEE